MLITGAAAVGMGPAASELVLPLMMIAEADGARE